MLLMDVKWFTHFLSSNSNNLFLLLEKKFKLTFCHAELIKLMHGVFLGAKNILLWFYYVALQAIKVKTFRAHHAVAGAEKSRWDKNLSRFLCACSLTPLIFNIYCDSSATTGGPFYWCYWPLLLLLRLRFFYVLWMPRVWKSAFNLSRTFFHCAC